MMLSIFLRNIMAEEPRVTRFRINWGDGPAEQVLLDANGDEVPQGEAANTGDPDSMMEPPPTSSFKDVHSMDESSNVEMEMAF